ncbi:hypothetical protein BTVI_64169 [Pitangus sulphuratus]|nr:hypothetical protein BTVI_64169 [Pitangus sulphuratus]
MVLQGFLPGFLTLTLSLCNEDRNLLRMRERERRSQEVLEKKDQFSKKTPLFAEPYKTNKEDELSSRIQNMLGNYEEVKEFMSNKSCQNLIGIPKSVAPLIPPGQPDCPYFPGKTNHTLPSSFQHLPSHPPVGPMVVAPRPPNHSIHYQKAQSGTQLASGFHTKSHSLSNSGSQGQGRNRGGQESQSGFQHSQNDRPGDGEGHAHELQASPLPLSPLLPCLLSSPVAPLSPLHSNQHINSRSQNSSKSHGPTYSQTKSFQDLVTGSQEKESQDSSAISLTSTTQPSSQTFPPYLTSKASAMQQKPTAYVRPMDGQDQAPFESLELKPLMEEYHEGPNEDLLDLKAKVKAELSKLETLSEPKKEPNEDISDLKAKAKAELSKLETPSEPVEQTNSIDVQSIEEILREMTRSWPPPLTALNTPTKAEPSKFPFPAKPEPLTSNKWQLDNWLTKVNPPAVPTEGLSEIACGDGHVEGKKQEQGFSSNSSHRHAEPREPHHQSQVARAPRDTHLLTKHNCQKPPVHAEEPSPRQTVGIKRPSKPVVHEGSKRGLKVESDPGPLEVRDQSSKDKPKVKKIVKPKSTDRKYLKAAPHEPFEKRKHKGSHQASAKSFLDPKLMEDTQKCDALIPLPQGHDTTPIRTSSHRPQDLHKEKLPLPLGEKLLSPVRDLPTRDRLVVKIDLRHLAKIPQPHSKDRHQKRTETKGLLGSKKQDMKRKTTDAPEESLQKRKVRDGGGGGFVPGPRYVSKTPVKFPLHTYDDGYNERLCSSYKAVYTLLRRMWIKIVCRCFSLVSNPLLSN